MANNMPDHKTIQSFINYQSQIVLKCVVWCVNETDIPVCRNLLQVHFDLRSELLFLRKILFILLLHFLLPRLVDN